MNGVHPFDQGDLRGAAQVDLYDRLVHATTLGGVNEIAEWLAEQTWCTAADWLAVAHLWGGNQLRDQLVANLARAGLVPA